MKVIERVYDTVVYLVSLVKHCYVVSVISAEYRIVGKYPYFYAYNIIPMLINTQILYGRLSLGFQFISGVIVIIIY